MVSTDQIRSARQVNVQDLASRKTTLRRVATTGGGEYAGPCPICGGDDRFHVQEETNRWFCRHCTGGPEDGGWKDAIELQMRLSGQTFTQAVLALTQDGLPAAPERKVQAPKAAKPCRPPDDRWQKRAGQVVERGMERLLGKAGTVDVAWQETDPVSGEPCLRRVPPLDWMQERGLEPATLQAAQIGYIPIDSTDQPAHWGLTGGPVYLSQGILIPSQVNGTISNLKIRRPAGKPKYIQVRGGQPGLFQAETLLSAPEAVCITEGELDAMLLRQCLLHADNPRWQALGVITLGSNSYYPCLEQWARYFYPVKYFLLFYDQDGKSQRAIHFWQNLSARTRLVEWRNIRPHDKDLTDYHRSGGRLLDLVSWALTQIEHREQARPSENPAPEPTIPIENAPQVVALPAPPPQRRAVIRSIEETAEYMRAKSLHIKSVTWPRGEPHPIVELE